MHDAAAAEDIAQEAFLAALRTLGRFDRRRPFGPWIHRIAVNRAIDWARARALRREVAASRPTRGRSAARARGSDDELMAALAGLPPEQRAIVVLRHVLDYKPREIADVLGLPPGNRGLAPASRAGRARRPVGGAAMTVGDRLRSQRAPDEAEAEDRAWRVLQAAFEEQRPAARRRSPRRLLLAGAAAVRDGCVGGRRWGSGRSARRRRAGAALAAQAAAAARARQAARSVRAGTMGGAPRRLEAAVGALRRRGVVAPRAVRGRLAGTETVALEPGGKVRWTVVTLGPADARWSPSGFRIAYRSGATMRVVAGDAPVIASSSIPSRRSHPHGRPGSGHVVAAADRGGRVLAVDVDPPGALRSEPGERARAIEWSADGRRIVVLSAGAVRVLDERGRTLATRSRASAAAFAPRGRRLALVRGSEVLIGTQTVFAGGGVPGDLAWSPDGRWLPRCATRREPVDLRPTGTGRQLAISAAVAQQFDPGATGSGRSPRVSGWAP